jgi:hypothetical protein
VGREGVVAQGGRRLFPLQQSPGGRLVVEAAGVEVPQDPRFCAEAAVQVDVSGLDAGCEVGARGEVVGELELDPPRVDFLAGGRWVLHWHLQQVGVLHGS